MIIGFAGVAGHRFKDDRFKRRRKLSMERGGWPKWPCHNSLGQFWSGPTSKWSMPADHFVKDDPERIDVAPVIQGLSPDLFGRGIVNTTDQRLRYSNLLVPWSSSQAKIHHFDLAPAIKHQVFCFDIAINYVALFVGGPKCVSNLCSVLSSQVLRHGPIDLQ